MNQPVELEVFLPAHNERESIERTLEEIDSLVTSKLRSRIVVCEDGSSDGTAEHVRMLAERLPVLLYSSPERKGYSRAVREGLLRTTAPWVLCLDSDGQCDPAGFEELWRRRHESPLIAGWRKPRRDPFLRRLLSRVFHLFYKAMFHVPLHDPSCPMVLMDRSIVERIVPRMGRMDQGFWWEFFARCHTAGIVPIEIPIHHRVRAAGETQIYRFRKMPGIFLRHLLALLALRFERRER
jgi:glycosyltransferase involved in cell wall biosynthesis